MTSQADTLELARLREHKNALLREANSEIARAEAAEAERDEILGQCKTQAARLLAAEAEVARLEGDLAEMTVERGRWQERAVKDRAALNKLTEAANHPHLFDAPTKALQHSARENLARALLGPTKDTPA